MSGSVANFSGSYTPPADFVEDAKEALVDISLTDSAELWLMQWPSKLGTDFDGCEVTLKLTDDGISGNFEDSSGKEYSVVSSAALQPDATVFTSSSSGSKIVGKISRRVSIVHYRDPKEDEKLQNSNLKQMYSRSAGTSSYHPSQSAKRSASKYPTSTHSSRHKSGISSAGETSKPPSSSSKGKRVRESTTPSKGSRETNSRGGYSSGVSSGSMGNSTQKSPKKKK